MRDCACDVFSHEPGCPVEDRLVELTTHVGQSTEKAQVVRIAEALRDEMSKGTSGRWIMDYGTTPESLAQNVWAALFPPAGGGE